MPEHERDAMPTPRDLADPAEVKQATDGAEFSLLTSFRGRDQTQ
jgi:hypothetical protein